MKPSPGSQDSNFESDTISDDLSQIDQDIQKLKEAQDDRLSEQSFGPTSQISSSSNLQLNLTPKAKKEEAMASGQKHGKFDEGKLKTTNANLNGMFDMAKMYASALRASSSYKPSAPTPKPDLVEQQSQKSADL